MKRLRILLVDDHAVLREGLRMLVSAQPDFEVVGEADTGRRGYELALNLQPDLVVVDVTMPEEGGAKVTERLREACPRMRVLALTRHADSGYLYQMLRAGAAGYVLKRSAGDELIRAIRAVAAGERYVDPAMTGRLVAGLIDRPGQHSEPHELSGRESEVLRLTAWGYSNKEIANELGISVKTVETHKAHMMEKLGLRSRVEVVKYAMRQGWLQEL